MARHDLGRYGEFVQKKPKKVRGTAAVAPRRRSFRPSTEAALVRRLVKELPEFFAVQDKRWGLEREVGVGRSIADLVLVVDQTTEPMVLQRPFSIRESVVLSTLRRQSERSVRWDAGPNKDAVDALVNLGVLVERRGDLTTRRRWTRAKKVVAIEAKLLKWRDALSQATAYRQYADESYVALPESHARGALAALSLFRKAGVGLLTVSEDGIRRRLAASRSDEHDWKREFVLSRLLRSVRA